MKINKLYWIGIFFIIVCSINVLGGWIVYDDFSDSNLNASKWTNLGVTALSNGTVMHLDHSSNTCSASYACIYSKIPLLVGKDNITSIRARTKVNIVSNNAGMPFGVGIGSPIFNSFGQSINSIYAYFPTTVNLTLRENVASTTNTIIGQRLVSDNTFVWYQYDLVGTQSTISVYSDNSGVIGSLLVVSTLSSVALSNNLTNITFSVWSGDDFGLDIDKVEYFENTSNSITYSLSIPLNTTFNRNTTPAVSFNVTSIIGTWNISSMFNTTKGCIITGVNTAGLWNCTSSALTAGGEYTWYGNATESTVPTNYLATTETRQILIAGGTGTSTKICSFPAGSIAISSATGCY